MMEKYWPKISIVTPSYNQGQFLEETILSVLNQNYPNLEYIIIDGKSTDNSIEIIKEYDNYLKYWTSESDTGQANAINKGLKIATGNILTWLCSDDTYLNNTLLKIAKAFSENDVDIVYGNVVATDSENKIMKKRRMINVNKMSLLSRQGSIPQPASFFRREVYQNIGPVDESLYYAMDYDFFLRAISKNYKFYKINDYLASFRYHKSSKTTIGRGYKFNDREREMLNIQLKNCKYKLFRNKFSLDVLKNIYRIKRLFKNLDLYLLEIRTKPHANWI